MRRLLIALCLVALACEGGPDPLPHPESAVQSFGSGVWSWFGDPRAIRYVGADDRTYIGYLSGSDVVVASYDHKEGSVDSAVVATLHNDDHANPSLRIRPDGRIQVFYSEHNGSSMSSRLSEHPEDVSAWESEQSVAAGSITYPNVVDLSDRVVLHWRSGTGLRGNPAFAESTDDGVTWGSAKTLFDGAGNTPYLKATQHPTNADRIDYVLSHDAPHRSNAKNALYHFYRDGGSYYASDGTLIGDREALPLAPADVTLLWDGPTEEEDAWQWGIAHDSGGHPVIVFAAMSDDRGNLTDNSDHRAMYARWTGAEWSVHEIASMGKTIAPGQGEPAYSAGVTVDPQNVGRVWVAVESGGGTAASLWRYDTTDNGATWSGTEIIPDTSHAHIRPVVPMNRHPELAVLFLRGGYDYWTDYSTSLVGSAAEAAGALTLSHLLED